MRGRKFVALLATVERRGSGWRLRGSDASDGAAKEERRGGHLRLRAEGYPTAASARKRRALAASANLRVACTWQRVAGRDAAGAELDCRAGLRCCGPGPSGVDDRRARRGGQAPPLLQHSPPSDRQCGRRGRTSDRVGGRASIRGRNGDAIERRRLAFGGDKKILPPSCLPALAG